MLFTTLLQGKLFCIILFLGILIGFIYELQYLLRAIFKNKIIVFILDLIYGIIFTLLFIFSINLFNYGEFRIYLLLAYVLGLIIETKTVGDLFRQMIKFICKKTKQLIKLLKQNKFCKIIFK